jgi:pyroglutamyl-peptidase
LNLDDASIPDNAGVLKSGELIESDGPAAYWSTLPLERFYHALALENIPVSFSNHAGTYLCNHVFYVARHETAAPPILCGFIHVPLIDETGEKGLPFSALVRAVGLCIEIVRDGSRL